MAAAKLTPEEIAYQEKILKMMGEKLRASRIAAGDLNYEKFAFKHDLNRSQLWRYENGEDLRISSLVRVLKALKITPEEFFKGFNF